MWECRRKQRSMKNIISKSICCFLKQSSNIPLTLQLLFTLHDTDCHTTIMVRFFTNVSLYVIMNLVREVFGCLKSYTKFWFVILPSHSLFAVETMTRRIIVFTILERRLFLSNCLYFTQIIYPKFDYNWPVNKCMMCAGSVEPPVGNCLWLQRHL